MNKRLLEIDKIILKMVKKINGRINMKVLKKREGDEFPQQVSEN